MTQHEYAVEVQSDFLERQTRAQPIQALAELIWNSVDAEATEINVEFADDKLGGMSSIVVTDNGHGIPFQEAPALFSNLGGSWKKRGARTRKLHRMLHGQDGQGRFKAFALGSAVDWKVVYDSGHGLFRYEISILETTIKKVMISDEAPLHDGSRGVTVVISDLKRHSRRSALIVLYKNYRKFLQSTSSIIEMYKFTLPVNPSIRIPPLKRPGRFR